MKKTVAVYGCNGFVGSLLVGKLLDKGYKVIGFDNCYKKIDSILAFFNNPDFQFQFCDITSIVQVHQSLKNKIDAVILLSGIVGLDACDYNISLATKVNVDGWKNVSESLPRGLPFVAASTGSVYGKISEICTEEVKTNPLSHYGITKLAGEELVVQHGGIAFRYATAAGISNCMRLNLLPNYLAHEAVHKKYISVFQPDAMRTFIDVRDFADSLIFGIENFVNLKHQVYNVGDADNNWSKRQMVEYIQSKVDCKVDWNDTRFDNDFRDYAVDYSRINEAGFKCQFKINDTLDELLKVVKYIQIHNPYN